MWAVTFLTVVLAVYGALVGASLASFACVVSDRVSRNEPFAGGRSRCACGRQLASWENVPVFGWVRVWGKARCCGARIPAKYVLAELAGGVFAGGFAVQMGSWAQQGTPWPVIVLCSAAAVLLLVWGTAALTWPGAVPEPEPVALDSERQDAEVA